MKYKFRHELGYVNHCNLFMRFEPQTFDYLNNWINSTKLTNELIHSSILYVYFKALLKEHRSTFYLTSLSKYIYIYMYIYTYDCVERKKTNERTTDSQYMLNDNHREPKGMPVYVHMRVCNDNCSMLQINYDYISIIVQSTYREKSGEKTHTHKHREKEKVHSLLFIILSRFALERETK